MSPPGHGGALRMPVCTADDGHEPDRGADQAEASSPFSQRIQRPGRGSKPTRPRRRRDRDVGQREAEPERQEDREDLRRAARQSEADRGADERRRARRRQRGRQHAGEERLGVLVAARARRSPARRGRRRPASESGTGPRHWRRTVRHTIAINGEEGGCWNWMPQPTLAPASLSAGETAGQDQERRDDAGGGRQERAAQLRSLRAR